MEGMWRTVVKNAVPAGFFIALTIPPPLGNRDELDRALREEWAQYGTSGHVTEQVEDGFAVHSVLGMPGGSSHVEFDNFYLRSKAFEKSSKDAGMSSPLEWLPLVLPPALKHQHPTGHWNGLVLNPQFRICRVRR